MLLVVLVVTYLSLYENRGQILPWVKWAGDLIGKQRKYFPLNIGSFSKAVSFFSGEGCGMSTLCLESWGRNEPGQALPSLPEFLRQERTVVVYSMMGWPSSQLKHSTSRQKNLAAWALKWCLGNQEKPPTDRTSCGSLGWPVAEAGSGWLSSGCGQSSVHSRGTVL